LRFLLKKDATIRRERFITIPSLPRKDVRGITSDTSFQNALYLSQQTQKLNILNFLITLNSNFSKAITLSFALWLRQTKNS